MGKVIVDRSTDKRIIGLTGGIATGKSTVSDYLACQHGLPVLDADIFSRQAVAKGSKVLAAIGDRYGPGILLPDGSLNRSQLGSIIFNDAAERHWIEQQIHPYVRARFKVETDALASARTLVYSIPLLFEANLTHLVTEIWVVFCRPEQQLERLMKRNYLTENDARARISAQISLDEKCKQADCILDNSTSKEALLLQVDRLLVL